MVLIGFEVIETLHIHGTLDSRLPKTYTVKYNGKVVYSIIHGKEHATPDIPKLLKNIHKAILGEK